MREPTALEMWLRWEGNHLKVEFLPEGIILGGGEPQYVVKLSSPLGSYMGSHAKTIERALHEVEAELDRRHRGQGDE